MKKIFILAVTCLLSACASLGPKFDQPIEPKKDEAVVYFYRPSKMVGKAISFTINENEELITKMPNGGYYRHTTSGGYKDFTPDSKTDKKISMKLENGKTYFVRGEIKMGVWVGQPNIEVVDNEQGLSEIKECKLIENKN